ncbi:hypothetical protein [Clostridium botulinum]|uniref:hypothetical protein n=1 Tax=Clostridium botulinum TaxID=1491 RepID=UPI003DA3B485
MDIEVKKFSLQSYIKCAYKKLKSNSYYDNRNMFLKNRIVDFENNNVKEETSEEYIKSIEVKFEQLEKMILGKEEVNFKFIHSSNLIKDNLKSQKEFTIRSVPKSIIDDNSESKIIRNFEEDDSSARVDKLMHYLDIDIMSQIIGTLWVMIIGKEIEKRYKDYTAGNILEEDISSENLKLFKPYYLAYERWRDDAIKIVDDRMNRGNRSTMLSLDIKEYYYSINLDIESDKEKILQIFKESKSKKFVSPETFKYINNYVFKVIEAYSQAMYLNDFSDDQGIKYRNILPIGFLPSAILSNWYLHEFDELVNSKINPLYYKRYVDDILIVLNTDYNKQKAFNEEEILNYKFYDTELFEIGVLVNNKENKHRSEKKNTEVIVLKNEDKFIEFTEKIDRIDTKLKKNILDTIEDVLNNDKPEDQHKKIFEEEDIFLDWTKDNPIKKRCKSENLVVKIKDINKKLKIESSRFKKIYLIKDYIENKSAYLIIQDEKVKVYDFVSNGSKALIENFKKEIKKNSSAFKFLPQKDEVLNSFDSEVYKVEYKDSIHKLSGIKDFKINRYNLSKFLARIIYSDKLENDNYTKDVDEKILWIFKNRYAVEYFFLWDKVFNYYLMNKRYDFIKELFVNIYTSIENLELDLANFSLINVKFDEDENNNIKINDLKTDLKSYLKFVLARNYALDDSIFINEINSSKRIDEYSLNQYDKYDENIKKKLKKKLEYENKASINIDGLYRLKEYIRISNMLNHSFVRSPLLNYYYIGYKNCYLDNFDLINVNFVNSIVGKSEILTDRSRCFLINSNYKTCIANKNCCNFKNCENNSCKINEESYRFAIEYSPRFVHLHECILNSINNIIARGEVIGKGKEIIEGEKQFYELNNIKKGSYNISMYSNINTILRCDNKQRNCSENSNKNNECSEICNKLLDTHFKYFDLDEYLFIQKERVINYLDCGKEEKKDKLKIGIVNMKIYDEDLISSFKKTPNISSKRLQKISELLNTAVKNGAEVIVFPEVSVPIEWLGVISDFARRHDVLIICGLEHIIYDNRLCCNYIATILPDKYRDYTYAVVKLRLKNHYSPKEKEWVKGYGWELPIENNEKDEAWNKEYDLFRWKGIDFSTFSCFELANIQDRALFTSFVDLLIGSVHNRDVNYYSNVMESLSRDVHCYFVHVNDSTLGDNRIIKPSSTNSKNILQVSGGVNDVVLIGEIDIKSLRNFQIQKHNLQMSDNRFKAVPPEFKCNNVKIRDNLPL